jgi:hypothetical protein
MRKQKEPMYDARISIFKFQFENRKSAIVNKPRLFAALIAFLLPFLAGAQPTTRNDGTTTTPPKSNKTKVLIIPWEPRMFNCNSDISRAVNAETGLKFGPMQEGFRKAFVDQLKKSFGANYNVISLIDDTAKMNKDLHYVYTCTTMSYTPVNFPLNATKADSARLKQQSGIQKGQVQTTEDEVDKFMNTIVLSPNLLGYLKKKYGADYVIFINEMDMDNDLGADPYNLGGAEEFKRSAIAHWTIFNTTDGKRVAMGKTKSTFSSSLKTTKKISDAAFPSIAQAIYSKFAAAVKPKQ